MRPRRAGSRGTTDSVREWVARSCTEQGVPVKVTDLAALASVGMLLGLPAEPKRAKSAGPGRGQSGYGHEPLGARPDGRLLPR